MRRWDVVVVGAGLYGAVYAQRAAEAGRSVLVLERRDHVGGNCHSWDDEATGVTVHAYGTHIFHTKDEGVWRYVNRFTRFNHYRHRVLTTHRGRVYSMPINLGTVNAFFGLSLRPRELEAFLQEKRARIDEPKNLEEKAMSLVGRELYEAFVRGYTQKQWGRDPRELPPDIITRLPVRTSYDDAYFDDPHQGVPLEGYAPMFARMLEGVDVELGVDFFEDRARWTQRADRLVFTGPIDRFFDHAHGRLSWRSVRFELERHEEPDHQGTSVMNYADADVPYTRIHEPKHLHPERGLDRPGTLTMREHPCADDDAPAYPVRFTDDLEVLARYRALAEAEPRARFGGRLAEYRYYDMDRVIRAALDASAEDLSR
ncbi:MAG TPA: UDP-galactopyranose mutase [Sandaracinaceae bacterium LLY-WYZ-13_1]|nr:UDP-galactopyranose mutase [Sandaracinaceae bacterium LLY-WYZ-13_1]